MRAKHINFILGVLLGAAVAVFGCTAFIYSNQLKALERFEVLMLETDIAPTFFELLNVIENHSIYELDDSEVANGIYQGILSATGDKYARFVPADVSQRFNEETVAGEFVGIGITFNIDEDSGYPIIVSVQDGGPAFQAGLIEGELILSIDGTDLKGVTTSDVVALTRGVEGKEVVLKVSKDSVERSVTVIRKMIDVQSVEYSMLVGDIGYIRLDRFVGTSAKEILDAYNSLMGEADLKGLILDITYNGGGTLESVADIAALFLKEGDALIQVQEPKWNKNYLIPHSDTKIDLPLVLLVNGSSASASEVLTGALQDYERATVLGTQTFGKGSMQTTYKLSDGSQVLVTTDRFLTPKGYVINEVGLEPDIVIEDVKELLDKAVLILSE